MTSYQYGGQALIEGVLMRGRSALAIALRHPDGSIVYATERLDLGLRARRALKLPFLRGLVVLYDTLVTGTRWLVRSATLQALAEESTEGQGPRAGVSGVATVLGGVVRTVALSFASPAFCAAAAKGGSGDERPTRGTARPESAAAGAAPAGKRSARAATRKAGAAATRKAGAAADPAGTAGSLYRDPDATTPSALSVAPSAEEGLGKGYTVAVAGMLAVSLAIGIAIFFLLPLFIAQVTIGRIDQGFGLQLGEGVIRVAIFLGYLILMSQWADVRRTFEYHGAEHMSIHTLEGGDPLTVEAARRYPTAHPRCGTEFLVVVLIVSILAFAIVGGGPWWYLVLSRIVLVPVIAAVSYEILQFGARHRRHALVRWLWSPGIWVQMITTRQPTDDMIEVAIVSLQRALTADGVEIPPGSASLASRPLDPEADGGAIATAPAGAP
jgi:uncharacterized protein YqhQ